MWVNSSLPGLVRLHCLDAATSYVTLSYSFTRFLLLFPLSVSILYLAALDPRRSESHSDVFAYNMAVLEMNFVLGSVLHLNAMFSKPPGLVLLDVGSYLVSVTYNGVCFLHALTCVERYVAVVHPITYLGLKNARGVRLRNLSLGGAWLLSFALSFLTRNSNPKMATFTICSTVLISLLLISFCSVSVLCALIGPRPGEGGRDRKHVDETKRRAFWTIWAILVVHLSWFLGLLVAVLFYWLAQNCVAMVVGQWLNMPASLVSPVLYLHRAGRLNAQVSWFPWRQV